MGPGLRGYTGIAAGRLRDREERVDGLEQAPAAFVGLLDGHTVGTQIVRVDASRRSGKARRCTADGA